MITDSFDSEYWAVINPKPSEKLVYCDVIIVTFSNEIEEYVVNKFKSEKIGQFTCVNGAFPVYIFEYNGKTFGFYRTLLGAAASVAVLEEIAMMFDCRKFLVFGSAGTLDKSCYGKVIVPTYAYRDEGASYHYAEPQDYIEIVNSHKVIDFMERHNIAYKAGKCWTTDAFYRETKRNVENRQKDGCIAVDMECAAMQAVCNFRDLNLYYFFLSGDLLDAPEWDEGGLRSANHNFQNFDIALHLAAEL